MPNKKWRNYPTCFRRWCYRKQTFIYVWLNYSNILLLCREFEQLATSVLGECHQKDPDKAQMIVERKSPTWNEITSLQIAAVANDLVGII